MESRKAVTLTMVFNSRRVSTMVLNELFRTSAVKVQMLRGRLSARTGWFELLVEGEARAVECVVAYCNPWSVQIPCVEPQRA